ncbi:MAG TPA: NnrS family protein [Candidatus Acidoferrales bacterium]|nr:NnrS family protein [Candidatus Acidoferrales bacterium]
MPTPLEGTVAASGNERRPLRSPAEIMDIARARESSLSRLLIAYISSGLVFMLLPGTFLGVWNLLQISGRESAGYVSPAWLQAHGHAQVFGWIGSFIFGIGFYSIPKLRGSTKPAFGAAWACWILWTIGVAMRWTANVYGWKWRLLLPVSSFLELAAFVIFFRAVSRHRPENSGKTWLEPWVSVVITASIGLMLTLAGNLAGTIFMAVRGVGPALPHALDQRYLVLAAWGFLVPFVWGFSTKWMPVFLGLKPLRPKLLVTALAVNFAGIVLTLAGWGTQATPLFVAGTALAIAALRMFESSRQEPKTRGVHRSFPFFVRMAYGWLLVAGLLGTSAARWDSSGGIWGASRHALTVGFIAMMVLSVGQRILPAFAGMRLLWSTGLMFASLALLTIGCALRVSCEILAYQGYASWAWDLLPVSAILELAGITAFAMNVFGTFILEPSHVQKQPLVVGIDQVTS